MSDDAFFLVFLVVSRPVIASSEAAWQSVRRRIGNCFEIRGRPLAVATVVGRRPLTPPPPAAHNGAMWASLPTVFYRWNFVGARIARLSLRYMGAYAPKRYIALRQCDMSASQTRYIALRAMRYDINSFTSRRTYSVCQHISRWLLISPTARNAASISQIPSGIYIAACQAAPDTFAASMFSMKIP